MGKPRVERVRVTIEVDRTFIKLLQANLQMKKGALTGDRQLEVLEALGVVAYGEMIGATEADIHSRTPIEWRPHIEAVHVARLWLGEGEKEWHNTGPG